MLMGVISSFLGAHVPRGPEICVGASDTPGSVGKAESGAGRSTDGEQRCCGDVLASALVPEMRPD